MDARLIRLDPGSATAPRRIDEAGAILLIAEGSGAALVDDVWVPVAPGDRIAMDRGDEFAIRADGGPIAAVLVHLPTLTEPSTSAFAHQSAA